MFRLPRLTFDDLPLQVTRQTPVGILAHPSMPPGRQGTSKCAARCASPAQWDIRCTGRQRGSASPTGPGRVDSRSANVSWMCQMSRWCYARSSCSGERSREMIHAHLVIHTYSHADPETPGNSKSCTEVHQGRVSNLRTFLHRLHCILTTFQRQKKRFLFYSY